jgi:sigma-70-like protein
MLGDVGRAQDMVQEAWLRWQHRGVEVESPKAFLVTVVTRLCLSELTSARARRLPQAPGARPTAGGRRTAAHQRLARGARTPAAGLPAGGCRGRRRGPDGPAGGGRGPDHGSGPEGRELKGIRNLRRPLVGARQVAAFVAATSRRAPLRAEQRELNGRPALVFYLDDRPFAAVLLAVAEGRIQRIFFQADPARLQRMGPLSR